MWNWLSNLFNSLRRALWSFLKAIFQGAVELILSQLRELAIEIVKEIADDPTLLTDEEKRNAAFERLKSAALDKGIETRDSLISLAIELAVTYCKVKGDF